MEIWYLGYSGFRIRSKKGIIIFNPYGPKSGQDFPSLTGEIVLTSRADSPFCQGGKVKKVSFNADSPGEYEVGGINIFGIHSFKQDKENKFAHSNNTIYLVDCEDIKLCHLGWLDHKLGEKAIDALNSPNLVFLPLGQPGGLKPKEAAETARQLEAKIIIPIHHQEDQFDKFIGAIESVEKFLKEMGREGKREPKLIVHPRDFSGKEEKVILIEKH